MKKLLVILLMLLILIISGCEEIDKAKSDFKEGFKNAKLKGEENITQTSKTEIIKEKISEDCIQRVKSILGDKFILKYGGTMSDTSKKIGFITSTFSGNNEYFISESSYFSGFGSPPETTKWEKISEKFRVGKETGEHKDWIYGSFEYRYDYRLKQVTDSEGIILGDNYFTVIVKVDNLSDYYPESINVEYDSVNPTVLKGVITLKTDDIVEITSCNFVN